MEQNYKGRYIIKENKLKGYTNLWLISGLCVLTSITSWCICFFGILGAPSDGGGDIYAETLSLLIGQIAPIFIFKNKKEYIQRLITCQIGGIIGLFLSCFLKMFTQELLISSWGFIKTYKETYLIYLTTLEGFEIKIFWSLFLWPLAGFIGAGLMNFYVFLLRVFA